VKTRVREPKDVTAGCAAATTPTTAHHAPAPPPPPNRQAVTSYDEMRGGAPYHGYLNMSEINDAELDRMLQLAEATVPSPWVKSIEGRDHESGDSAIFTNDGNGPELWIVADGSKAPDELWDFIASARPGRVGRLRSARGHGRAVLTLGEPGWVLRCVSLLLSVCRWLPDRSSTCVRGRSVR
jgi:hypothetical protein